MGAACVGYGLRFQCCLCILFVLTTLGGCVDRVPLQNQDIAGHLWLRTAHGSKTEGFFTGPDGQLLVIDNPALSGVTWSLQGDRLFLELHDAKTEAPLTQTFNPQKDGNTLLLIQEDDQSAPGFSRVPLMEPLSKRRYHPVYLFGMEEGSVPQGLEPVYLQFEPAESSVHGFGGVNNFHGHYQRQGTTGFKVGPLASTMMSGSGMDYELQLLQGLDQADTFLAFGDQLWLFHGKSLLISLRLLSEL